MSYPYVVGIDPSLAATAACWSLAAGGRALFRTEPGNNPGTADKADRIIHVVDELLDVIPSDPDHTLVVIEGPSHNSKGSAVHQVAGMWWAIVTTLRRQRITTIEIPPATLKKYATGKGAGVDKADMRMALYKRTSIDERNDNLVDAIWLHLAGTYLNGNPQVDMPAVNREGLDKLTRTRAVRP